MRLYIHLSMRSASPLPIRIVPLPFRYPDRYAGQIERLAQAVHQEALVTGGQMIELIPEQHEMRGTGLRLRHVTDFDAPTGHRGRRRLGNGSGEPPIELSRGDALVPDFVHLDDRAHQPV